MRIMEKIQWRRRAAAGDCSGCDSSEGWMLEGKSLALR